jgi:hypothetical protein
VAAADGALTLDEWVSWLSPPITRKLLAALAAELLTPAGTRRSGKAGRPFPVYSAADVIPVHAALAPWLRHQEVTGG